MLKTNLICELKPYIQPFERTLALKELESVTGARPRLCSSSDGMRYIVPFARPLDEILDALTYWETVSSQKKDGEVKHTTTQVRIEAAHVASRSQRAEKKEDIVLPRRRELRYGPHGIHEYRGKFFPQLVGSLLNVSHTSKGGLVLDPMCGSGTTIVEAAIRGHEAIGIDFNPLSVLISNAKAEAIHVKAKEFRRASKAFTERIGTLAPDSSYFLDKPDEDREYLSNWFDRVAIKDLSQIASAILLEPNETFRKIFTVILSNILRRVSMQRIEDLRVRKKAQDEVPDPVMPTFHNDFEKAVNAIAEFSETMIEGRSLGHGVAVNGDARRAAYILRQHIGKVDAIITSPPYATALPYLDTDRLSLSFLGLLSRPKHRHHDFGMIGNRELTGSLAEEYWRSFLEKRCLLPRGVTALIDHLVESSRIHEVGFRRRNLPYLLAKYFLDMRAVLGEMKAFLKPGGTAFVVIGNNSTVAGGQKIDIRTDAWLAEIANDLGFSVTETLPMEMLVSRDIFRGNAIARETILFLKRPARA